MNEELKGRVAIFDTTLRDGEQAPGYSMTLDEKSRMAERLDLLGADVIEAGFAIASPGDFESVRRVAGIVKNACVASLSRALKKDIDAAWEAVRSAARPRIHTFLATSDLHLKYKLKMSREDALRQIREMVAYARNKCGDVEFSAEDASRTDIDFLCRAAETAIAAGRNRRGIMLIFSPGRAVRCGRAKNVSVPCRLPGPADNTRAACAGW